MKKTIEVTIEKQKEIQLLMLNEFKRVCDINNINYSLGGGTLLGAIRHKGYIPWDDDIDVMMMRSDYEKILQIFNEQCEINEYKLLSYKNTDDYYYPFAKIVNLKTKIEEYSYKKIEELGIYIDIFPIDFLPNDEKQIKRIYKKYKNFNILLNIYKIGKKDKITKNKIKLILKKPINWLLSKFKMHRLILKNIDNLGTKYNNTNKVACISGRYFEKEIMSSNYISDYLLVDFENEKYKAAIGYHDYLTKHYGDYMKLPPKDKQISNHDNIAYWKK